MAERFFSSIGSFSIFLLLSLFTCILIIQSCKQQTTPDIIAQEFIDQLKTAVDDRTLRGISELISKDYHDTHNRNRRDIAGLASAYLIRSKSLHLFTDLVSAGPLSDSSIKCRVLAAFAATPVANKSLLPDIQADFYWFDIELIEENGDWKVLSAVWQQAMLDDFFNDDQGNQS